MDTTDRKYQYIFSLRLAGYLMLNGFRILRIHHNLKTKGKDVYLFENSEKLQAAIGEYLKYKNKIKEC